MTKTTVFLFLVLTANSFCHSGNAQESHLSRYVNPFIGTEALTDPKILGYELPADWRAWSGLTFPGSSLPNAMVQLSPMTKYQPSGAGYEYEDSTIVGFSHTNKGHWNLGNIPVMPLSNTEQHFSSRFSHEEEKASPGFYQVRLLEDDILVSLTSTLRSGFHRYEFKNNRDRKVLFDLSRALSGVSDWNIKQEGSRAVSGFQSGENVYFYAEFSQPIQKLEKEKEGQKDGYALVSLKDGAKKNVEMKIGLSFVSVENAKENLSKEIGNRSFEEIRKQAEAEWEKKLATVQVKGGTDKQKTLMYSSLYRSLLWPALRSDVNGQFRDAKGEVVRSDFRYYTEPSLWDTYRNKDVLLSMLSPDVTLDVIKSMKEKGEKTGFIPTFFHGDHGASSITGAYLRGITDFDVQATFNLLLRNATVEGRARPHLNEYLEKGFISDPEVKSPHVETKGRAGVSKTLEYAYDDYSLAQLAKALGDDARYTELMKRSKNYRNVFDSSTNFMRGRLADGTWMPNFNPEYPYYEYMFREGNAWQLSFYVPHDMPGLIELYGGAEPFEKKLDSLFQVPWNPTYIARNVESMIGQYCHGNQPDHEAPFSYYFINKPEKTQHWLDYIMNNLYGIGDNKLALCGMDDAGELSAWYVFTSLGLYTFSATDPEYLVTVPLFDEVSWTLPNGKELRVLNPKRGRKLTGLQVNGKKADRYYIPHELFNSGGEVVLTTE